MRKPLTAHELNEQVKDCCACSACANSCPREAISMPSSTDGTYRPLINEYLCIGCKICLKQCPRLNPKPQETNYHLTHSPNVYTAWSKDNHLRMQSSSGGLFSELAKHILQQGGVVYGVAWSKDWKTEFRRIETEENLSILRGSKYVQAYLGNTHKRVKEDLKSGIPVLFTGVACQIEGLKRVLGQIKQDLLVTAEVICHGAPVPLLMQSYIAWQESVHNSKVSKVSPRNKAREGWKSYHISLQFENKQVYSQHFLKDYFMQAFLADVALSESCYSCSVGKGRKRIADLTLGDAWGVHELHPELETDKGISLLLINSQQGERLITEIKERLHLLPEQDEDFARGNPFLLRSAHPSEKRETFISDLQSGLPFNQLVEKHLTPAKPSLIVKLKIVAKNIKRRLISLFKK